MTVFSGKITGNFVDKRMGFRVEYPRREVGSLVLSTAKIRRPDKPISLKEEFP